ncbi:MAG: hypothetical protein KF816_15355 [Melioribacteraceae bacterium]|jgi:hypothetical protein|nr:hypothetical protein [Melioribacteraceae bacterium]
MRLKVTLGLLSIIVLAACSSLVLQPGDFAWPIENVLKVDGKGNVEEKRYSFNLNVKKLFYAEFADSNSYNGKEVRLIRDKAGFYFMTGAGFKNVYVFIPVESGLKLENKILISEQSLNSPIINQKSPNIEIIDGTKKYLLNSKGIVR